MWRLAEKVVCSCSGCTLCCGSRTQSCPSWNLALLLVSSHYRRHLIEGCEGRKLAHVRPYLRTRGPSGPGCPRFMATEKGTRRASSAPSASVGICHLEPVSPLSAQPRPPAPASPPHLAGAGGGGRAGASPGSLTTLSNYYNLCVCVCRERERERSYDSPH